MVDDLNLHDHPKEGEQNKGMGSPRGFTNSYWDKGMPHVGESGGGFSKKGVPKPGGSGRDSKDRFDRPRGPKDNRRKRPTSLQKFGKRFNGSGDPYDHAAQYRQLIFVEGVTDVHTMVQGFGLTMEGRALLWFETLKPSVLYDFETLIKRFIEAYSKIGHKY